MIGYVTVGVSDLERAKTFWCELLSELGFDYVVGNERVSLIGKGQDSPMIGVCLPWDGEACSPGNGNMISINVENNQMVDKLHAKAIALGATDEGAPGVRVRTSSTEVIFGISTAIRRLFLIGADDFT